MQDGVLLTTPPLSSTHAHAAHNTEAPSLQQSHNHLLSHILTHPRPRVRLEAQMSGGGQERGLRSGTVPTASVVGLGAACEVAGQEMAADHAHVRR